MTAERLTKTLASYVMAETTLVVLDRGMSAAAARGVGYAGSLNLTLAEARALGAAVGCDFYLAGDAQTIRRSSSSRPVYFESYASVFVVGARTGKLVLWDRPAAEAATIKAVISTASAQTRYRSRCPGRVRPSPSASPTQRATLAAVWPDGKLDVGGAASRCGMRHHGSSAERVRPVAGSMHHCAGPPGSACHADRYASYSPPTTRSPRNTAVSISVAARNRLASTRNRSRVAGVLN